tara:strand:+ start:260 stop:907 length:648 start_codon:yes stop_codon:yes gene_type:complete
MRNTKIYLVSNCYGDPKKVYIGKTVNSSRKGDHRRKYGKEIDFIILEEIEGTDKNLWKPRETYWIKKYIDLGYNLQNKQKLGGSGVDYHSPQTIQKLKDWRKNNRFRLRQDIEDKKHQIIEEYNKGTGPHNLGKKYECHPDVIKRILKEGNITLRTRSESQKCRKGEIRRKDLYVRLSEIELLYSQGMNYTQLGKMFNTSDVQIKNLLTKVKKPH